MTPTLGALRAHALTRSLPPRADLAGALTRLGYVQADPIRAPARAQDLILMQRVRGYRAGDLERRFVSLGIHEDFVQNYGFVTADLQPLLHPRETTVLRIERDVPGLMERVLAYVLERGEAHPRDVETHFGRTRVGNAWGGGSSATTRALEGLHYRGQVRVVRREAGVRVYGPAPHLDALRAHPLTPDERARGLVNLLLRQYAPLPQGSLGYLVTLLGYGAPGLRQETRAALRDLPARRARVEGVTYLWPEDEEVGGDAPQRVRLLTPFDPVVWDRRRFEHLHGWAYRFEAYTPASRRQFGYYALPLMWGERAVGWANLAVSGGELDVQTGFVGTPPGGAAFRRALDAELGRYRTFLGLSG